MNEKKELLNDIKHALRKLHYKSSITGFDKTFMPHHINAVMNYLTPVVDKFFNDCLIQSKKKIWRD